MEEKIWVVVAQDKNGEVSALAYDDEGDARHFADEMNESGTGTYSVCQAGIFRHEENEESLSQISLPEFNDECIECLIDAEIPDEKQMAAKKFLEENREELQQHAQKMVDQYLKNALTDFFMDERYIIG